jgi:molybdenum cofactor cytidylyltransferase
MVLVPWLEDNLRALTVDITASAGRVLCSTIFKPGGRKLFGKGHILSEEDIQILRTEGMEQVWVTELEEGEVGEDDAVLEVAQAMGCGCLEIRPAAGGRANLFATEDCCVLVDDDLLRQINCTASIVIATANNFTFQRGGVRLATVKSAPFAIARAQLEAVSSILRERGPILQARPIRRPTLGIVYTDPLCGGRARQLFEGIMRQRLERYPVGPVTVLDAQENSETLVRGFEQLLRMRPTGILVASTTTPSGPEDSIGQAMSAVGCHIEKFLAPVEPGNLLLLGYHGDTPIISAPGCFRSAKPNVLDLLLPPVLSRYRISGWELACLGHGGLLC